MKSTKVDQITVQRAQLCKNYLDAKFSWMGWPGGTAKRRVLVFSENHNKSQESFFVKAKTPYPWPTPLEWCCTRLYNASPNKKVKLSNAQSPSGIQAH